ncbi:MAG: DNA photolyase [Gammaproteobacteria bacterium]|nr:DNA photolyase [Gammaproteobacteria bacterium]
MIETIYIESGLQDHPRAQSLLQRYSTARVIPCEHYGEVFNPSSQNFRLQKLKPALIIANKQNQLVLPSPDAYGIGMSHNYYFSHMLNCLYDCRYCFLQGMFASANYVWFVNYEDFAQAIHHTTEQHENESVAFYSGYDCDSLALESLTGFAGYFLNIFRNLPNAWLELRTKSPYTKQLLREEPFSNCVVAYSFTPDPINRAIEYKVPANEARIKSMQTVQQHGWSIGLRFDPLIYCDNYKTLYSQLFKTLFAAIDSNAVHSVSLGPFRLPERYMRKLKKLYPDEKLLACNFPVNKRMASYPEHLEHEMMVFVKTELLNYISADKLYPCVN